jgi:hypothetical protein
MSFATWNVMAGETPTEAKWNILGDNDDEFHALIQRNVAGTGVVLIDSSGNEILVANKIASAVNEVAIQNAATGNAPVIGTSGGDTNIDMTLTPKGTGKLRLNNRYEPYKLSAYCSTGKAIANTSLIVDLQTELYDTNSNFASSRYTAPIDGFYLVCAQAWLGSAGAGTTEYGEINIRKNGSATGMPNSPRINGSGASSVLIRPMIAQVIQLTAGDYIELWATFVGSRDIVAGQGVTFMQVHNLSKY